MYEKKTVYTPAVYRVNNYEYRCRRCAVLSTFLLLMPRPRASCLYSLDCREEKFSATGLPLSGVLGNSLDQTLKVYGILFLAPLRRISFSGTSQSSPPLPLPLPLPSTLSAAFGSSKTLAVPGTGPRMSSGPELAVTSMEEAEATSVPAEGFCSTIPP